MISKGSFMQTSYLCVLIHIRIKGEVGAVETGLSPPLNYFTDRTKVVLLLWIFYIFFCFVFAMPLCASVYMCLVVICWERADLLALVRGV